MQPILFKLRAAVRSSFPGNAILSKLLHRRSQLRLHEREVIDATQAQDAHARERRADAVHERAARAAEVVGHGIVLAIFFEEDGLVLAPGLQALLPAQVLQVRVHNSEVGRVHRRAKLVAVGAVADERADVARAVGRLGFVREGLYA